MKNNQKNETKIKKRFTIQDFFFYVGILTFIVVLSTMVFEYTKGYTSNLKNRVKNTKNIQKIISTNNDDVDNVKSSGYSDDEKILIQKAMNEDVTYQDVRKRMPNIVTNPNVSVDSNTNSNPISNETVVFDGYRFNPSSITISKSSIVTWENPSNKTIRIQGDGWQSLTEIKPKTKYSQEFDFVGEYNYWIQGIDSAKGVIIVK